MYGLPTDLDDSARKLKAYVRDNNPAYELLISTSPADRVGAMELMKQLTGGEEIPSTIITDQDGKIVLARLGVPTISELRALLASH
jgi:hypothetical protein